MKNRGDFSKKEAKKSADKKGSPAQKQELTRADAFRDGMGEYETRMEKTISVLESEFATIRAGQANPAVLDRITVEYYGVQTPIAQVATISAPEPRALMIQPWDASTLKAIEKSIQASDIGINPQNDGRNIRLNFPPLTEERRRELVRQVKKLSEDAKVAVRNIRRDAVDAYKNQKKKSLITEDDYLAVEKSIQDLTDRNIVKIDGITAKKEKELIEV